MLDLDYWKWKYLGKGSGVRKRMFIGIKNYPPVLRSLISWGSRIMMSLS